MNARLFTTDIEACSVHTPTQYVLTPVKQKLLNEMTVLSMNARLFTTDIEACSVHTPTQYVLTHVKQKLLNEMRK